MRTAIITIVIIAVFLEVSGLIWSGKDGEPGDAYRRVSQPPDKLINDPRSNGYFMMIGFPASADSDPVRTGLDIWQEAETDGNRRLFNYRKSGRTQLRTTLDADEAFPAPPDLGGEAGDVRFEALEQPLQLALQEGRLAGARPGGEGRRLGACPTSRRCSPTGQVR